jgi:hypothetical protein
MRLLRPLILVLVCAAWRTAPLLAQMPFYTDDPAVTEPRVVHFEFFNEYDALQSSQFPNLNQNTANFKLNYGFLHNLEGDIDVPYLSIYRASAHETSAGMGDFDLGLKWGIRKLDTKSHIPALGTSFYIEFPTGNVQEELGSGLHDYWLNTIAQEPFGEKTRLTANFGYLFAGNTSTGVIGVSTTRGHVYTGGLSLLHDFTKDLTLGAEAYGGLGDTKGLGKDQLQFLGGGSYQLRDGFSFTFAVLGGKFEASPHIGGQFGFAVDFPNVLKTHD